MGEKQLIRAVATLTALVGLVAGCTSDPTASSLTRGTGPGTTQVKAVRGLDPSALAIMNKAPYAGGGWAISMRDIDTGETLISLEDSKWVQPGSVVKTYSTGAAWLQFGPDRTIVTPVKRSGEVTAGTLNGDLVLVGKGDLTMGGRTKSDGKVDFTNLDHNDANQIPGATLTPEDPLHGLDLLAAQVKQSGINSVTGNVVVDDRLWDKHAIENGPITPIIINNNVIDFTTTPTQAGQPANIEMRPKVAPWTVSNQVQTVAKGAKGQIKVTSPDEKTVVLQGTVAADSPPVVNVYAFKDPATFARTAFIEALQRAGVTVTANPGTANPDASLAPRATVDGLPSAAELKSLPLDQDATYTLKVSYNRGAETFVCLLAVAAGSTDCGDGFPKLAELWSKAGLDPKGTALVDGSGLPGCNILAANQTDLQVIMAKRPDAARWRATLPILGVDGSLAMVQPDGPAKGKVWAKTGTLGNPDLLNNRIQLPAKALGGYIDAKSGRRLAFAIVAWNSMFDDINGVFAANDDVGKVAEIIQQSY